MDLLSIFMTLWRHKAAVLVVTGLTALAALFIVVAQPSEYESRATLLLVPPPRPPANEPLGAVSADNPYTRAYDAGIVINVVAASVNSDTERERLIAAGADRRFEVAQTVRYGFSSPVAEIVASGDSPSAAKETVELVLAAFQEQLRTIQAVEDVDERYFIVTRVVDPADPGVMRASTKLRPLIGVVGLGIVALFTVVTTSEAIARMRAERAQGIEPGARPEGRDQPEYPPVGHDQWEPAEDSREPAAALPPPPRSAVATHRVARPEPSWEAAPLRAEPVASPPAPVVPLPSPRPPAPVTGTEVAVGAEAEPDAPAPAAVVEWAETASDDMAPDAPIDDPPPAVAPERVEPAERALAVYPEPEPSPHPAEWAPLAVVSAPDDADDAEEHPPVKSPGVLEPAAPVGRRWRPHPSVPSQVPASGTEDAARG